jgi:hypothetical protein
MGRTLRTGKNPKLDPYGIDESSRSGALAAGISLAALIMFSGLILIAFIVATLAMVSPQTVRSPAFPSVSLIVIEVAQFLTAAWAGRAVWRRIPDRAGAHQHLWAASGPVAVVLAFDVTAAAVGSTAWWRLLLDLAVTALGVALQAKAIRARRRY